MIMRYHNDLFKKVVNYDYKNVQKLNYERGFNMKILNNNIIRKFRERKDRLINLYYEKRNQGQIPAMVRRYRKKILTYYE